MYTPTYKSSTKLDLSRLGVTVCILGSNDNILAGNHQLLSLKDCCQAILPTHLKNILVSNAKHSVD